VEGGCGLWVGVYIGRRGWRAEQRDRVSWRLTTVVRTRLGWGGEEVGIGGDCLGEGWVGRVLAWAAAWLELGRILYCVLGLYLE
jgi:hypothetical protein